MTEMKRQVILEIVLLLCVYSSANKGKEADLRGLAVYLAHVQCQITGGYVEL